MPKIYYVDEIMSEWYKSLSAAKEAALRLPKRKREELDGKCIYGAYSHLREVFSETPIRTSPGGVICFGRTRKLIYWK